MDAYGPHLPLPKKYEGLVSHTLPAGAKVNADALITDPLLTGRPPETIVQYKEQEK
jgi:hypothetical protein